MFLQVFSTISVMFILIFIGMLARRIKIINKDFTGSLSNLLILVTLPALIFYSILTQFSREMVLDAMILIVLGVLSCFLGYFIGVFLLMFLKSKVNLKEAGKKTFLMLCAFGNTSFLSIPIGFSLYGPQAVVRIILFDFGVSLIIWTFGIGLISSGKDRMLKKDVLKNILNPGIVALIAGFIVIMVEFKLPQVLIRVSNILGSVTIPMSLIATGSLLYGTDFYRKIEWKTLTTLSMGKLLVVPFCFILIVSLLNLSILMKKIIILEAAMPSMVLSSVLAERYNSDSNLAASGVFWTTLLSAFTVPFFLSIV